MEKVPMGLRNDVTVPIPLRVLKACQPTKRQRDASLQRINQGRLRQNIGLDGNLQRGRLRKWTGVVA